MVKRGRKPKSITGGAQPVADVTVCQHPLEVRLSDKYSIRWDLFIAALRNANYAHYHYVPTKIINEIIPDYFKKRYDARVEPPSYDDNNGKPP